MGEREERSRGLTGYVILRRDITCDRLGAPSRNVECEAMH